MKKNGNANAFRLRKKENLCCPASARSGASSGGQPPPRRPGSWDYQQRSAIAAAGGQAQTVVAADTGGGFRQRKPAAPRGGIAARREVKEIDKKEIQDKIRETQAKLAGAGGRGKSLKAKYRREKRQEMAEQSGRRTCRITSCRLPNSSA